MKRYIVPVNKVPYPDNRIFKDRIEWQNWFRVCLCTSGWAKRYSDAEVVILTGFKLYGAQESEADIQRRTYRKMGVINLRIEGEIFDLLDQAVKIRELAAEKDALIVVVVCDSMQYLRLRWLCRGLVLRYEVTWGLPNFQELLTDLALVPLFPLIDILGFRDHFSRWIRNRRLEGKV